MKLPEFGVNRPVFTGIIFAAILFLGLTSLSLIPLDLLPDIEIPTISVVTIYPGASTEDVETRVTQPIEDNVSTVQNLKEVTSTSSEGVSAVMLQFEWGSNLNEAMNDIRQSLDIAARSLPEDAEDPFLIKMDLSMMPVLVFGITAEESFNDLYRIAKDEIGDRLKRLPGVASVTVLGGHEREIQVFIDRQRMEAHGLTIDAISKVLRGENTMMAAGNLKFGALDYNIRIPGEFRSVEEVENTIVGMSGLNPVRLRDVAEIRDGHQEAERITRINKRQGVGAMISKQSGANTVQVANAVKKALPDIQKRLPPDVKLEIVLDSSDFIKQSLSSLGGTIFQAILFVVFVVVFFLKEARGSLIIGVTIPFSLIVAFIFLYVMGYSLNVMSLSAIALAIGMVVDNAIVIYENIYRHRAEEGDSIREASLWGANEVSGAIISSTLTTLAIFLPILFVKGITGILFKQLSIVVIIVLSASLFCALTLTPMMASRLLQLPGEGKKKSRIMSAFGKLSDVIVEKMIQIYQSGLRWTLGHRWTTIWIGMAVFVVSVGVAVLYLPTEFMPENDRGEVSGVIKLPVGARMEITEKVISKMEEYIERTVPERKAMFMRCGKSDTGMESVMGQQSGAHIISLSMRLVSKGERSRSDKDIGRALAEYAQSIPGVVDVDFSSQQSSSIMGGKPISVELYGNDIAETDSLARNIREIMSSVRGITDVAISRELGKPELWVEVDKDAATTLGITTGQIASTLRSSFYGTTATKFRDQGEEYDLFLRYREEDRQTIADIENTLIMTPSGVQMPIRSIGRVVEEQGPVTIQRQDQGRVVYIEGGLYQRTLGEVVKELQPKLNRLNLPPSISLEIGGSAADQAESFRWLFIALIVGIVLVYMVMAAQFESLRDPFIVMFSVPFSIMGVIWGLFVTGYTLSLISFVGMIMLVGIVVNNAIVLVDYTNILRARGMPVHEAILTAGRRRFRPVLMTALTTMLGLLPLAMSSGEGSETWAPLGVSVISGLLVSTVITLVFVPTLYSIFEERRLGKNSTQVTGGAAI